jgi:hypothetical protein
MIGQAARPYRPEIDGLRAVAILATDGRAVDQDGNHLSHYGAFLLADLFGPLFDRISGGEAG